MKKKMFTICEDDLVIIICDYLGCDLSSVTADKVRLFLRDKLL